MKEFELTIDASIRKGLRPVERLPRNTVMLVSAHNVVVGQATLEVYEAVTIPFDQSELNAHNVVLQWPFPQLLRGRGVTLLADRTKLMQVTESGSSWQLSDITIYQTDDMDSTFTLTAGDAWHFADAGQFWLLTNGHDVVWRGKEAGFFGLSDRAFGTSYVRVHSVAAHRGRLLLGGFLPGYTWRSLLRDVRDELAANPFGISPDEDLGENFVFWSSIGGGDALMLLQPRLALYGLAQDDQLNGFSRPLMMEYFERGDMGWMPMPWQGAVRRLLPLGRAVVVYGDDGAAALVTVSEPVATYALVELLSRGVYAAGGSVAGHVVLDDSGELWFIDPSLKVTRLGYKEYGVNLLDDEVLISYSPVDDGSWWLSNGVYTYVWRNGGLTQVDQIVTSAAFADGGTVGFGDYPSSPIAVVETDTFDMGLPGIKSLQWIGVGMADEAEVAVSYRYSRDGSWKTTGWKKAGPEGLVHFPVSGIEFRVHVRTQQAASFALDELYVRWTYDDKRFVRGMYASKSVGKSA